MQTGMPLSNITAHMLPMCVCVCVVLTCSTSAGWQRLTVLNHQCCPDLHMSNFMTDLLEVPVAMPSWGAGANVLQLQTHLHCISSECFAISLLLCFYSFRWLHVSFAVQHCPPCSLLVLLHILWIAWSPPLLHLSLFVCAILVEHAIRKLP